MGGPKCEIVTQYDGFAVVLHRYDIVIAMAVDRLFPGKFNRQLNRWIVDASMESVRALRWLVSEHGVVWGEGALARSQNAEGETLRTMRLSQAVKLDDGSRFTVEGLGGTLYEHQLVGVAFCAKKNVLVGDDVGVGKTPVALATVQHERGFPALVVCPSGMRSTWEEEARKWLPNAAVFVLRKVADLRSLQATAAERDCVAVTSYEFASRFVVDLRGVGWRRVVLDESHYIASPGSARTKACVVLADQVRASGGFVMDMTATALPNYPRNLVPQLRAIGRLEELGGDREFVEEWQPRTKIRVGGRDTTTDAFLKDDDPKLRALGERLRSRGILIRRTKEQVFANMPRLTREVRFVDREGMDARALGEYLSLEAEARAALRQGGSGIGRLGQLRRLLGVAKIPAVVEWACDALAAREKVVVFAWHKDVVWGIAEGCAKVMGWSVNAAKGGVAVIDGSTGEGSRDIARKRFQNETDAQEGALKLMVVQQRAGGVGLTLTAAALCGIAELDWHEAGMVQTEGRLHRAGQKRPVNSYWFAAPSTIDDGLLALIREKGLALGAVQDLPYHEGSTEPAEGAALAPVGDPEAVPVSEEGSILARLLGQPAPSKVVVRG